MPSGGVKEMAKISILLVGLWVLGSWTGLLDAEWLAKEKSSGVVGLIKARMKSNEELAGF